MLPRLHQLNLDNEVKNYTVTRWGQHNLAILSASEQQGPEAYLWPMGLQKEVGLDAKGNVFHISHWEKIPLPSPGLKLDLNWGKG